MEGKRVMPAVWMIAVGFVVMMSVMGLLWWTHGRRGNAGIVDVAWSLGVGGLAVFYSLAASEGNEGRRMIVAVIAAIWSWRLAAHVLHRVRTMPEDGRYVELKRQWGQAAAAKMLTFFGFQAVAAVGFSLPMLVAATATAPLGIWDALAVLIWLVAITGESLADRQLQRFREDSSNRGKTCRQGLWRYSRHPNYFFEWLHWFAYVLLSLTQPWGWLTIAAPLAMLYFILYVTGVPPTERQALLSRGEDYRQYQRQTSVFFPWPPRHSVPANEP